MIEKKTRGALARRPSPSPTRAARLCRHARGGRRVQSSGGPVTAALVRGHREEAGKSGSGDNVVDAEFEEVKDKDRKAS